MGIPHRHQRHHTEIKKKFPMGQFAAEVWTGFAVLAGTSGNALEASVRFLQGITLDHQTDHHCTTPASWVYLELRRCS